MTLSFIAIGYAAEELLKRAPLSSLVIHPSISHTAYPQGVVGVGWGGGSISSSQKVRGGVHLVQVASPTQSSLIINKKKKKTVKTQGFWCGLVQVPVSLLNWFILWSEDSLSVIANSWQQLLPTFLFSTHDFWISITLQQYISTFISNFLLVSYLSNLFFQQTHTVFNEWKLWVLLQVSCLWRPTRMSVKQRNWHICH